MVNTRTYTRFFVFPQVKRRWRKRQAPLGVPATTRPRHPARLRVHTCACNVSQQTANTFVRDSNASWLRRHPNSSLYKTRASRHPTRRITSVGPDRRWRITYRRPAQIKAHRGVACKATGFQNFSPQARALRSALTARRPPRWTRPQSAAPSCPARRRRPVGRPPGHRSHRSPRPCSPGPRWRTLPCRP